MEARRAIVAPDSRPHEFLTEAAWVDVWIKFNAWVIIAARAVPLGAALAELVEPVAARAAEMGAALARTTVARHFEFFFFESCVLAIFKKK
jgi:hypothetical protein